MKWKKPGIEEKSGICVWVDRLKYGIALAQLRTLNEIAYLMTNCEHEVRKASIMWKEKGAAQLGSEPLTRTHIMRIYM
jgi:hypothetical protein